MTFTVKRSCYRKLYIQANSYDAICSNNLQHTAGIASFESKNRTNLSQMRQRNEVVTTCRSYELLLQIASCELAFSHRANARSMILKRRLNNYFKLERSISVKNPGSHLTTHVFLKISASGFGD